MAKIEDRLSALAKLQSIDSQLDKILILRGSLPEEVADLEDDVEGLETRKGRILDDIKDLEQNIADRNNNIKHYGEMIKKYEGQLDNVKNNREFDALNKEIEYANLEILTSERKIRQFKEQIEQKQVLVDETQVRVDERNADLEEKKKELEQIMSDTAKEEEKLREVSGEAEKDIEDRVLRAYKKIRNNMRNGLAVVSTDRNACGGCFAVIPPQIHLELRQKKKLIVCENCGRILVDASFFSDAQETIAPVAE